MRITRRDTVPGLASQNGHIRHIHSVYSLYANSCNTPANHLLTVRSSSITTALPISSQNVSIAHIMRSQTQPCPKHSLHNSPNKMGTMLRTADALRFYSATKMQSGCVVSFSFMASSGHHISLRLLSLRSCNEYLSLPQKKKEKKSSPQEHCQTETHLTAVHMSSNSVSSQLTLSLLATLAAELTATDFSALVRASKLLSLRCILPQWDQYLSGAALVACRFSRRRATGLSVG